MTCIVGIKQYDNVWIGGDSAGVSGLYIERRVDTKVFRNGPFIMGFTISFRMGQLLAHAFNPPKQHPDTDVYAYMVTDFIDGVRACLKKGGFAETKDSAEIGGTFLVGYQGRLFGIESDYQVAEYLAGYVAIGCGRDIALGSLHSTDKHLPETRIKMALKAAEEFSAGVCGPFKVLSLIEDQKMAANE